MRRFIAFFVRNRSFTLILFVALLALGGNSLLTMPRGEDPEVDFPTFTVVVVYPGASPGDIEDQVVQPIEKRVNELDRIKKVNSTSADGLAIITVEYEFSVKPDDKYQEIVREMNAVRADLPTGIQSLEVKRFQSSDVNVYQFALLGPNVPYERLEFYAEQLQDELEKVPAVKKVNTWGYPQREVRVALNLEKLRQSNIPVNAVLGALQSENVNIPGGSVAVGARRFNVKTSGDFRTVAEIGSTVVAGAGGRTVPLRDVADIGFNYEEARHLTRLNGVRGVLVTASQKTGQNIFELQKQVAPRVTAFQKTLPKDIRLVTNFDQSQSVAKRLSRLGKDFGLAILLVSLTLLPLGWRAALVVMISIPLSLSIGLFLLDALGFTINQLSIVGLIVALGILVDDAIVVVENIERYLRTGQERLSAVIDSTSQLALAVIGVTVTLIVAFIPLLNLPAGAGAFIRSLPLAVVTAVTASLVVSLTIVPFLASVLLRASHNPQGNVFLRVLNRGVDLTYGRLMHWSLGHPKTALLVAFGLVGAGLTVVPKIGFSLFPKAEKPQFLLNIEMPNTAGIPETDRVARDVERVLARHPEVTYYTTNVGKGQPDIYYNVVQRNEQANFGQIFVQCTAETYEEKNQLVQRLRRELAAYPNARLEVKDFEQGPPLEAPVAVRIFGDNLDTLRQLSFRVERELRAVPGTTYLYNPVANRSTDLKIDINREKAGQLGVATADIDRTVRLAVAGIRGAELTQGSGQDKLPVNVTLARPAGGFQRLDVLDRLSVGSASGQAVPLRALADVRLSTAAPAIRHLNQARYTTVNAYAQNGYLYATLQAGAEARLQKMKFPAGYHFEMAGEQENKADSFAGFGTTVLLTVFAFVLVLVLEFGSVKSVLIVLSVIPLGGIGGVLALYLSGNTFSFTALIGFIALVGIEIKNSILLVDYTNQLRAQGVPLKEAIEQAGETRFIPILLTTLTAIGGLIPLVLEPAPLYTPLALVLIGGLLTSLLLSRIVTPVLYLLLPPDVAVDAPTAALETAVA